jgi:hypothetical protein
MTRMMLAVLTTAGLLATASAGAPAAEASTVTCYGDYCSGEDPEATGCAEDADTIAWEDLPGARLEIRWSPTCKTNWARYQQYPRGLHVGNAPLVLSAVQDTGYTQSLEYGIENPPPEGSTTWTPMIYSPVRPVRAELAVHCGAATLIAAAFDCATNGTITTGWG